MSQKVDIEVIRRAWAGAGKALARTLRSDPGIATLRLMGVMPREKSARAAVAKEIKRRAEFMTQADAIRSVSDDLETGRWRGGVPAVPIDRG